MILRSWGTRNRILLVTNNSKLDLSDHPGNKAIKARASHPHRPVTLYKEDAVEVALEKRLGFFVWFGLAAFAHFLAFQVLMVFLVWNTPWRCGNTPWRC